MMRATLSQVRYAICLAFDEASSIRVKGQDLPVQHCSCTAFSLESFQRMYIIILIY